jgi:hypothetical protein
MVILKRLAEFWQIGKTEEGVGLVEAERMGCKREKGVESRR